MLQHRLNCHNTYTYKSGMGIEHIYKIYPHPFNFTFLIAI